jgi:hypothetical protein
MTQSQSVSSPASGGTLREVIDDPERLAAVAGTGLIQDGRPDPVLYRLARQARRVLDVPTVYLSVLDDERRYFAAADGLSASLTAAGSTPLSHAFCLYTVGQGKALVDPDARVGEGLAGNPAIAEHGTVAYVGVPVLTAERRPIGALCATDESRGSGASSKSAYCTTSLRRLRYACTSEQLNDQGSPDD